MKNYKITIENPTLAILAKEAARAKYPRKKNWNASRASTEVNLSLGDITEDTFSYKGRFHGYGGSNYVPRYISFLNIVNKFYAEYIYGFAKDLKAQKLHAPVGLEWDKDGSLVMSSNFTHEYHPTLEDILSKNFAFRVRQKLRENIEKRNDIRRLTRIQLNNLRNTLVTYQDSRRAGNCESGTLKYAASIGLDVKEILRAPWLGVPAERLDNSAPCQRAIIAAIQRETLVQI